MRSHHTSYMSFNASHIGCCRYINNPIIHHPPLPLALSLHGSYDPLLSPSCLPATVHLRVQPFSFLLDCVMVIRVAFQGSPSFDTMSFTIYVLRRCVDTSINDYSYDDEPKGDLRFRKCRQGDVLVCPTRALYR